MPNKKIKLVLASCCAPCSAGAIKQLADGAIDGVEDFIVLFYNPNIFPNDEYLKRMNEQIRYCESLGVKYAIGDWDHDKWRVAVRGLENEPERGKRCSICFYMRLERVMKYAKANGYDAVASVLGVSRYKNLAQVQEMAHKAAAATGVPYVEIEGRKNGMQELRMRLIKELDLYSQKYCGCKPLNEKGEE